jgi:hypothetical protein
MAGGPYGAEHAVILPSQDGVMNMAANVLAMAESRKAKEAQRQREEADRQDALVGYLGKEFDEKNFATGTPTDRVINDSLRQMKQNYTGMIMKNPNIRMSEMGYMIQNDVEKLNRYSVNAKTVRAGIEDATKGLEADKSVDAKAVKLGALNKAFFDLDPESGQYKLKDPDQIDLNRDYTGEFMQERPDLWVRGNMGIEDWVNNQKAEAAGEETTTDKDGIKNTSSWSANLRPYQQPLKDESGKVVGIGVKANAVEFPDGTRMQVLDKGMYESLINANRGTKGYLDKMIKKNPVFKDVDLNSEEGDLLRRRFAFEELSRNFNQGDAFKVKDIEDRSALRERADLFGAAAIMSGRGGQKEEKPNVIDALIRAKNGDPSIVQGDSGKGGMIDITSRMPGATVYSGKTKKMQDGKAMPESYSSILFNPKDGEVYYTDERNSKPKKVENFDTWIEDIAEANGVPLKKVSGIKERYRDGAGGYKWLGDTPKDVSVKAESDRFDRQVTAEINEFSSKKDPSFLNEALEREVKLPDGTIGKISDVKLNKAWAVTNRFGREDRVEFSMNGKQYKLPFSEFEKIIRGQ